MILTYSSRSFPITSETMVLDSRRVSKHRAKQILSSLASGLIADGVHDLKHLYF